MTFPEFDALCDSNLQEVLQMRNTKGKEYARSADRLANFKRIADEMGITPAQVAWVYLAKHLDGIKYRIQNGATESNETTHSRIIDALTYLLLIDGLLVEELEEESKDPQCAETVIICKPNFTGIPPLHIKGDYADDEYNPTKS
jgi:hypothetical protein